MSRCMNTAAVSVWGFDPASRSGVYNFVKGKAGLSGASTDVVLITPPDFYGLDVPTASSASGASIQGPQGEPPVAPEGEFTPPSLTGVTYTAAQSLINFAFQAPMIGPVSYLDGLDQLPLPSSIPEPPPLNYPQQGLERIPNGPGDLTVEPTEFELDDWPELVRLQRIDFEPTEMDQLDLSDFFEDYEPPDVDVLDWQDELIYEQDEALIEKVSHLLQGNDEIVGWLSTAQEKLYLADTRQLPKQTKQRIDQIMEDAAGKNFSLPHGPAEALVLNQASDELEERFRVTQKIRDEVYEASMNALTAAISRAIAIEQYHFKLHMRYLQQNLRVYRLNLEMATLALNTMIEVYSKLEARVALQVDAYNLYVRTVMENNQSLIAQFQFDEAAIARYRAQVEMYSADVGLTQKSAQVAATDVRQQAFVFTEYNSKLRGTMANLQIVEQNLNAFREAVRAHSNQTQWYDAALTAYETSIDTTASKIAVDGTKFDVYRQLWGAEGDRVSAYNQYLDASMSAFNANMQDYREAVSAQRDYIGTVVQSLGVGAEAAGAYSQAAQAMAGFQRAYNSATVSEASANAALNLSDGVTNMVNQALRAEAQAHEAKLDAASEAAKVTAAGALAQAGAAIFQVSASATAGASHRVSGRDSGGNRFSASDRKSFSKVCTYVERPMTL